MRLTRVLALVALIPAALNAAAWAAPTTPVPICSGDGSARSILIAGSAPSRPRDDDGRHCPKGCHAGPSRKRTLQPDRPGEGDGQI